MTEYAVTVHVDLPEQLDDTSPHEVLAAVVLAALRDADIPVKRIQVEAW